MYTTPTNQIKLLKCAKKSDFRLFIYGCVLQTSVWHLIKDVIHQLATVVIKEEKNAVPVNSPTLCNFCISKSPNDINQEIHQHRYKWEFLVGFSTEKWLWVEKRWRDKDNRKVGGSAAGDWARTVVLHLAAAARGQGHTQKALIHITKTHTDTHAC